MSVIASDLTKIYRLKGKAFKTAVDKVSFEIPDGQITAFIGPNGAGKSTTIKMLTGILTPDGGSVSINGLSYPKDRKKIMLKIGTVFGQKSVLCWDIPVLDTLKLFKDMYGVPDADYKRNMEMFADILGLNEFIAQPPRLLSLGQRMKADLAASLLHNPENFILQVNKERKTTVILTTHDVSDIETLCEKMMVIDKGLLLYDGSLTELKALYKTTDLEVIIKKIYLNGIAARTAVLLGENNAQVS